MDKPPSRYSVQIALDQKLLEVKGKSHDLCCAWGFLWDGSNDPIYNIVGWISPMDSPVETIAWDEKYYITASKRGHRHGKMVNKAMEATPIVGGQEFIVTDFQHTEVRKGPDTLGKDSFGYRIELKCSIVLNLALDLEELAADNSTPAFIASEGEEPLDLGKTGAITPTKTLLFFFVKKNILERRHGFNFKLLEHLPIVYDYGNQSTQFTKIKLVYKDSRPQLSPDVEAKKNESLLFLMARQPVPRLEDTFESIPMEENSRQGATQNEPKY